jgi:hypothetical protein
VHETVDKGHGRLEIRKIQTSTELRNYLEFPYHQQVMRIERITLMLKSGKQRHEVVYGITSLSPLQASPQQLLELNRGHWSIENSLHHVRDTTFDEDRSQIRTNTAPQVMATLKNLAISILRLNSYKNIASALRHFAAQQHLTLVLIGI